jgi:acetyl esterase/lipase
MIAMAGHRLARRLATRLVDHVGDEYDNSLTSAVPGMRHAPGRRRLVNLFPAIVAAVRCAHSRHALSQGEEFVASTSPQPMTTNLPTASAPEISPTASSTPPPLARWVSRQARLAFESEIRGSAQAFDDIARLRAHYDQESRARLQEMRRLYPVETASQRVGGIPVDVVVPAGNTPAIVADVPVLVCLHGGGFAWGAGAGALLEAVPIAAVSGITVVAVDYRLAPEHRHPAAIDDVLDVYQALLADRPSRLVGLYGCSAGGILVSQTLARLQARRAPKPGAVAMMHATGIELDGDLLALSPMLCGDAPAASLSRLSDLSYFAGADTRDPTVFPGEHPEVLADFPPSLLISSTRDFAASSISVMHRRLLAAGTDSDFILFDGLWHAFHMSGHLPESRELYDRVSEFFLRRLR